MTEQPHFTNDGCTGQSRALTALDSRQIRELARRILKDAASGRTDDVVAIGRSIALHYGPEGEWLLACLLATYVLDGANGAPAAGPFTLPQVSLRVPLGDAQADLLLCALSDPKAPLESPTQRGALLDSMRHPVQEFMIHAHGGHWRAASALWKSVYRYNDPAHRQAFTTLLVLWAARCTLPPTVPAPRTRQEAAG